MKRALVRTEPLENPFRRNAHKLANGGFVKSTPQNMLTSKQTAAQVISSPRAETARRPSAFFLWSPFVLQNFIWPFVRPLFRFFIHFDIRGREHLAFAEAHREHGVIFAVSHSSELDSILLPAAFPFLSPLFPMFYTSREWTFYKNSSWRRYFYGGFLFKLWGAHRLQSGKHNYEVSLQTHIKLLEAGKSLCMFPDGKQLPENEIGTRAHGGVGYLAWRTGALVVPTRITGVYRIGMRGFLSRKRACVVAFGNPFPPSELFPRPDRPGIPEIKTAVAKVIEAIKVL